VQSTLPDDQAAPAEFFQSCDGLFVTLPVAVYFCRPELCAGCGDACPSASLVAVPETAVDKDDAFTARQNYIRLARQVFHMEAETAAHGVQQGAHRFFGFCIPSFDAGHIAAAFFRADGIHTEGTFSGRSHNSAIFYGITQKMFWFLKSVVKQPVQTIKTFAG
jgi:hypothetical protein